MRSQIFAHARSQDRRTTRGVEAAPVHDTHAAMSAVAAVFQEALHPCARLISGQSVQIAVLARRIVTALQLSEFAPIDAEGGKRINHSIVMGCFGCGRRGDRGCSRVHPSTGIGLKRDDVGHLPREGIFIGGASAIGHLRWRPASPGLRHTSLYRHLWVSAFFAWRRDRGLR
jgi:hypothetical protein